MLGDPLPGGPGATRSMGTGSGWGRPGLVGAGEGVWGDRAPVWGDGEPWRWWEWLQTA